MSVGKKGVRQGEEDNDIDMEDKSGGAKMAHSANYGNISFSFHIFPIYTWNLNQGNRKKKEREKK
jgi:hypothetical protein